MHLYAQSDLISNLKDEFWGTINVWYAPKVFHSLSPGSKTVISPETTVMYSTLDVPNSYSPLAITPIVARPSSFSKLKLTTLPSKY